MSTPSVRFEIPVITGVIIDNSKVRTLCLTISSDYCHTLTEKEHSPILYGAIMLAQAMNQTIIAEDLITIRQELERVSTLRII